MTTIIVGVDGSAGSRRALRWALDEAAARKAAGDDPTVVGISAWEPMMSPIMPFGPAWGGALVPDDVLADTAQEMLSSTVAAVSTETDVSVESRTVLGRPAHVLVDHAARDGADLIVLGSRGHGGFAGLVLGSVSTEVSHTSPCPVALIPDTDPTEFDRVVVGIDGSANADEAARWAIDYATRHHAAVRVVAAWRDPETSRATATVTDVDLETATARMVESLAERLGVTEMPTIEAAVEAGVGSASRTLLDRASDADLLVIGARGRGGIVGLLRGSVATQVLHHMVGPTVVVPSSPADK